MSLQSEATRGKLTTSASKPPKLLRRVNPMSTTSTKRASLDVNRVKIERDTKSGMGNQNTKYKICHKAM